MAQLTEEVGEVARIIARRYGEQSEKESDKAKDLGEELSDVLLYLIRLADRCHVDLSTAVKDKLKKNAIKYPAQKVFGCSKKYDEYYESN